VSDDAGTGQGRLQRSIAYLIVAASILGAVVSWRASVESQRAGGLDQTARQEQIREARVELGRRELVGMDLRVFGLWEERQAHAALLASDAERLEATEPRRARALGLEAQRQSLEDETLWRALFLPYLVENDDEGGYRYDTAAAQSVGDSLGNDERRLDSAATRALAREVHARARVYLTVALLLVLVLLFLTLAQISEQRRQRAFAGAGALTGVVAGVLFFLG
jgi:hypothetical protein